MGNCQAAEAATVVIQHPDGKIERVYWSVSASHVMASNPGHYVAVIITSPHPSNKSSTGEASRRTAGGQPSRKTTGGGRPAVKHLKLLRPDDTLLMGHVYRLVSFEEVVRKFETKRHAKLSRLIEKSGGGDKERSSSKDGRKIEDDDQKSSHGGGKEEQENSLEQTDTVESETVEKREEDEETDELVAVAQALIKRAGSRPNQWRPALHTISEVVAT
ncbi:hypothetical protein LUZ60_005939 [Juncus effusus]|nr:hypothetical protein LUZ60_005939 [Juncus effusus]